MTTNRLDPRRAVALAVLSLLPLAHGGARAEEDTGTASATPPIAIPNARAPLAGVLAGGQPTAEQLRKAAAADYRTVIDIRLPGEDGALDGEAALVESLGMRYVHIPVAGGDDLTLENVTRLDAELDRDGAGPILFHCASGNRVGALLALRAAWLEGVEPEEALALGKEAGLTRLEPRTRELLGLSPAPAPQP
jgi:uncharacterized protein (TIGR01244 family)